MRRWHELGATAVLLGAALLYLAPILFMASAAFTPDERVLAVRERGVLGSLLPTDVTLRNFADVFARLDFLQFLANSLIVVGGIVLVGLLVNSLAGYALTRLRWRGRGMVLIGIFALLVVPFEAIAVPLFVGMAGIGWVDSLHVQILPFIAHPFSIHLFATFFRELPDELDEAARLDGASSFTIYWRIALPLAKPAIASSAILSFLMYWGSYLWPLLVTTGPRYRPLPVAIGVFPGEQPVQWADIMAFGLLMVLPVMVVFLLLQRSFVRGIASSGLKG